MRTFLFSLLCAALLLPAQTAAATEFSEGAVPQAASALARIIDGQVAERLGQGDGPAQGVSLAVTVPVSVSNLEESNPLARQMAEELARWFSQAGYSVQEIRKGKTLLFEPEMGEMLLTRRIGLLGSANVKSSAILVGTYTLTPKHARFNIRLVETNSQEVLGIATVSVPLGSELKPLLGQAARRGAGIEPTVATMLP